MLLIAERHAILITSNRPHSRGLICSLREPSDRSTQRIDQHRSSQRAANDLGLTDPAGNCRYNFRDAQCGSWRYQRSWSGAARCQRCCPQQWHLEPSIGLQKCDPATGAPFETASASGNWLVCSITLPLKSPCLMGQGPGSSRISLPGENCVYDKYLTKRERLKRNRQ